MTQEQLVLTTLIVSAAAALALAFFGAVQLYREHRRLKESRAAARGELEGPAWLARKYCDAAVQSAEVSKRPPEWALRTAFQRQPVEVETKFLEVGRAAFDSFLAAADRVREIAEMSKDEVGSRGGLTYSGEALIKGMELEREAVSHLRDAINALEVFAPRREHEPALPPPDNSPQLESGEGATVPTDRPWPILGARASRIPA